VQVSAEIRWFWRNSPPHEIEAWFRGNEYNPFLAGGGPPARTDKYLYEPGQAEIGLKIRGNNPLGIEVKGMVSESVGHLSARPFSGPIEIWTKWTATTLDLGSRPLIVTHKTRWLRKFDTTTASPIEIELSQEEKPVNGRPLPERGCNTELTHIELPQKRESWWSLGFESFGTIASVEMDLRAVAGILANRKPPKFTGDIISSYPRWLNNSRF